MALQTYFPKTPLKSKIRVIQRSVLHLFCSCLVAPASGLSQDSSRATASTRNPEAITNLEHLFMQLIFLQKKGKNHNNKPVNNSWACVAQPTAAASPQPRCSIPSRHRRPLGQQRAVLPAPRAASARRQNCSTLVFFSGFNSFFLFFSFCCGFVFIKKEKKSTTPSCNTNKHHPS